MSILSTMDKLHHFRTWVVPQALRRYGILEEGYNPKRDRYEHKLLGYVFKATYFPSMTDLRSSVPLVGKSGAQYPFVPTTSKPTVFLKKKFEVVLPNGGVRRYSDAKHLAQDLTSLRRGVTLFNHPRSKKMLASLSSERRLVFSEGIKKKHGIDLSQSGCDPASIITIRNLRTNKAIYRRASDVDLSVYNYNHGTASVPIGVAVH